MVSSRDPFRSDPHPSAGRILFVGDVHGSHARSWMNVLRGSNLNIRCFGSANGTIPADMDIPTYTPLPQSPLSPNVRPLFTNHWLIAAMLREIDSLYNGSLVERALRRVVRKWRPDIVHSFGIFPASEFYLRAQSRLGDDKPLWVVQARGGPDIEVNRHIDDHRQTLHTIFQTCDSFIADTDQNLTAAVELGLPAGKCSSIGRVPGTGGIDVDALASGHAVPPSQRERLLFVPKAYEHLQSKVLPVLEALKIVWPRLAPCKIICTAVNLDALPWFRNLPAEMQASIEVLPRLPRERILELMTEARVVLAPSVMDGIPNTLLEAMAGGAIPIVSPLPTITPHVSEPGNVFFARNLFPHEIGEAILKAMDSGEQLDRMAHSNLSLVRKLGDKRQFEQAIPGYYAELLAQKRRPSEANRFALHQQRVR